MALKQTVKLGLQTQQRMALLGRLRMADWIEMPEKEFAKEIAKVEKDELFKKLFFGRDDLEAAIRRQRWPHSRISGSFYEVKEHLTAGGERVQVEEKLDNHAALVSKIQKIGQDQFETIFLHSDEPMTQAQIAKKTGLSLEDVKAIFNLLLEIDVQDEFSAPSRNPSLVRAYSCIASITLSGDEPTFEFFSAHWTRGLYQIRYDVVERWKRNGEIPPEQMRRLPRLLKRLETLNLRQSTLFRVLENVSKLQVEFLTTRRLEKKLPISLRQLSRRLDLAPSTVSRALCGRSIKLPWGKEIPLIELVPGRRRVLREILTGWLNENSSVTDGSLTLRLQEEYQIKVSRRTVNAVRNELKKKNAF